MSMGTTFIKQVSNERNFNEVVKDKPNVSREGLFWKANKSNEIDIKRKYKNVNCVNCGEKGHVVRHCNGPITSFGIIAFKVVNNSYEERLDKNNEFIKMIPPSKVEADIYPKIKFLMIQRKDTMGYSDLVRGQYPDDDDKLKKELLCIYLREMTHNEKKNLLEMSFDEIWDKLWINHESKTYKNEYNQAKIKYEKLNIKEMVANSKTVYEFSELGFAKGRRSLKESNITCAEREFFEETGYTKDHYDFIKNYNTIQEEFTGTNGIRYRHVYYLVKMKDSAPPPKVDQTNIIQIGEVKNIGWFSYDECINLIRPYDLAKKNVIRKVHYDIQSMNQTYICSNFYYNNKRGNFLNDYSSLKSRSI
jgi:8-oxo-dGTP pyrophosphatase MutT (NUDIX family)